MGNSGRKESSGASEDSLLPRFVGFESSYVYVNWGLLDALVGFFSFQYRYRFVVVSMGRVGAGFFLRDFSHVKCQELNSGGLFKYTYSVIMSYDGARVFRLYRFRLWGPPVSGLLHVGNFRDFFL